MNFFSLLERRLERIPFIPGHIPELVLVVAADLDDPHSPALILNSSQFSIVCR